MGKQGACRHGMRMGWACGGHGVRKHMHMHMHGRAFFLRFFFRKVKSSMKRCEASHTTKPCSRVETVELSALCCAATYTGLCLEVHRGRGAAWIAWGCRERPQGQSSGARDFGGG